jgi:MFS family permease
MGARLAPSARSGLTLSVLASCGMLGGAVSPILAGMLGQLSLRSVFITVAAAYLVAVGLALLPSVRRAPVAVPETTAEA